MGWLGSGFIVSVSHYNLTVPTYIGPLVIEFIVTFGILLCCREVAQWAPGREILEIAAGYHAPQFDS